MILATSMLTLALFSAPQASSQAQLAAANDADLRCMALVAMAAGAIGDDPSPEELQLMAGLSGGLMYYLGRLEGRAPQTDWLSEFGEMVMTLKVEDLEPHQVRCGKELEKAGQALVSWGDKLAAF